MTHSFSWPWGHLRVLRWMRATTRTSSAGHLWAMRNAAFAVRAFA